MAVTDNTALFRARCKMITTRQNALKLKDNDVPEPLPLPPADAPSPSKLQENSPNFRLYASQARDIIRNISELRDLVMKKRRGYILCCGASGTFTAYGQSNFMTDVDRRQFDSDSDTAMRQCGKLIKTLKAQVDADSLLRSNDEMKHLKTVIQLLTVFLKDVCKVVAQLREIHLNKMQNLQRICRLANLVDLYHANLSAIKAEENAKTAEIKRRVAELESAHDEAEEGWESIENDEEELLLQSEEEEQKPLVPPALSASGIESEGIRQRGGGVKKELSSGKVSRHVYQEYDVKNDEDEPAMPQLSDREHAQLMLENESLFVNLARTNTEIEKIERQMNEIKRLQDTFAEKVLEQEQGIEQIHTKTVHTLDNLEAANDFIRQAIQNSASRRVVMLFCLIVLTFTLLFLDWYNP